MGCGPKPIGAAGWPTARASGQSPPGGPAPATRGPSQGSPQWCRPGGPLQGLHRAACPEDDTGAPSSQPWAVPRMDRSRQGKGLWPVPPKARRVGLSPQVRLCDALRRANPARQNGVPPLRQPPVCQPGSLMARNTSREYGRHGGEGSARGSGGTEEKASGGKCAFHLGRLYRRRLCAYP